MPKNPSLKNRIMKLVRFVSDNQQRQFSINVRKNVNRYFEEKGISVKSNIAMVIKTIAMISLYIGPFVIILTVPLNAWIALALAVLMGIGLAGIGMSVMHDAVHGSYSRRQWVNKWLGGTMYLLGSNVLNWKIQHNVLHHTFTNITGLDEDIDDKGPIRLSDNRPLKFYHRYQFIYAFLFYGLMTFTMLINDFTRLFSYHKASLLKNENKKIGHEFAKMLVRKIIYLSAIIGLPIWLTDYSVWQILLGFFIMHWTGSIILSFVFQMAHVVEGAEQPVPQDNIPTEWSIHQLNTTSDFGRSNRLLSWYVGGLNFQIEHHLFPNICHIHYREIAPIIERTAIEFGLTYNLKPTFRNAFASHVRRLKELGTNKSK